MGIKIPLPLGKRARKQVRRTKFDWVRVLNELLLLFLDKNANLMYISFFTS